MGVTLPKPLMTKVEERSGNAIFRVGCSCVNGFRENMEDAHIAYLKDHWGFFGVFDGHVNENCSAYLEGAFREELDKITEVPITDKALQDMALKIDREWLSRGVDGGSTGTFFLVHKTDDNMHLQVGNVGDSRVIACVGGECFPLTEDHKPSLDKERQRIYECGGTVQNDRVDGSLAVSRAFGDRDYKQGSGPELQQKVIALPDVSHINMKFNAPGDFVVLCCDGVFESNFSNEEVIEFVKEKMETVKDLAELSGLVCEEAVSRGSRDNISCMIVQFTDGADMAAKPAVVTVPGPFNAPRSNAFVKMYKEMAIKGGMSIEEALEIRYDTAVVTKHHSVDEDEQSFFGKGPGDLTGEERRKWFLTTFEDATNGPNAGGPRNDQMSRLAALQQQMGIPLPVLLALMGGGMGGRDE